MNRLFRTGLTAGLLALALTGAACGSGSPDTQAKSDNVKSSEPAGAADQPAPAQVDPAPAAETPTPAGNDPAPAVHQPASTVTTAARPVKPAVPKPTTTTVPKPTTTTTAKPAKPAEKVTLRLGYFPNLTHAPAIAGVEKGIFSDKLGPDVDLKPGIFNAGPAAVEAIFSGALDATYIGPNPSINAFVKSKGEAIRIVAGATSGGAFLVVKPNVNSAADLKDKKVSSPQLGNTQDVALQSWLTQQGLKTDLQGGGDVHILPQDNSQILQTFRSGDIAGAWVPEPWATRMVQEGGGKVLVDERSLWPNGDFVTTQLIVRTAFLKDHPDTVHRLLEGHMAAVDYVNTHPEEAQSVVNAGLAKLTGQAMQPSVVSAAWKNMRFTFDPLPATLKKGAADAKAVGLLDSSVKLDGIYDLGILNDLLVAAGKDPVQG